MASSIIDLRISRALSRRGQTGKTDGEADKLAAVAAVLRSAVFHTAPWSNVAVLGAAGPCNRAGFYKVR
jgi:hypothetical protein